MKSLISINFNIYIIFLLIILIIFSITMTLISKNPIYSVLFLMLSFTNVVFVLILLGAEFLSILLLVIYVGAISILFLFVIMMVDIKLNLLSKKRDSFIFISTNLTIFFIFILTLIYFLLQENSNLFVLETHTNWISLIYLVSDIKILGFILYNFYFHYFFFIGIILLVAMISCITLVSELNLITKKQNLFNQILVLNTKNLSVTNNSAKTIDKLCNKKC